MRDGFTDYERFIRDLLRAINDEAEAINFYRVLYDMATNDLHRDYIKEARDDEKRHFNLLSRLYRKLVGADPVIELRGHHRRGSSSSSSSSSHHHHHHPPKFSFVEGIQRAFDDEQAAYILYRDLILMTSLPAVRDILIIPLTDENEHAQKFNWIFTDLIRLECCVGHIKHVSSSREKHCSDHKHHKHHSSSCKHKHHKHHSSSSSSSKHKHHSSSSSSKHKHHSSSSSSKHKHRSDKKSHGKHKQHSRKKHHKHRKHRKH
jgi:rubrerythrin